MASIIKRVTLKLTRDALAKAFNNDMQAIKAMEGLQAQTFDILPTDIAQIIQQAAADAQQASMIANQLRQQLSPYLQAVSVPIAQQAQLQAVSSSCDCNYQLPAV